MNGNGASDYSEEPNAQRVETPSQHSLPRRPPTTTRTMYANSANTYPSFYPDLNNTNEGYVQTQGRLRDLTTTIILASPPSPPPPHHPPRPPLPRDSHSSEAINIHPIPKCPPDNTPASGSGSNGPPFPSPGPPLPTDPPPTRPAFLKIIWKPVAFLKGVKEQTDQGFITEEEAIAREFTFLDRLMAGNSPLLAGSISPELGIDARIVNSPHNDPSHKYAMEKSNKDDLTVVALTTPCPARTPTPAVMDLITPAPTSPHRYMPRLLSPESEQKCQIFRISYTPPRNPTQEAHPNTGRARASRYPYLRRTLRSIQYPRTPQNT